MANAKAHRARLPESQTLTGSLVLGAILSVALATATVIAAPMPQAEATEGSSTDASEYMDMPSQIAQTSGCDHFWVEGKKSIQHPAITHDVVHEAIYEQACEQHSVCNDCNAEIDGIAVQHLEETGHSGYTTGVPITKTRLVQDEWKETVTDSEAWEEEVADGTISCRLCGEKRRSVSADESCSYASSSVVPDVEPTVMQHA